MIRTEPGQLRCHGCKTFKPDDEMVGATRIRARGWNTGECKECKRGRPHRSPEAQRRSWLLKAYKLTEERYGEMLDLQGSVCAICKQPPKKNKLHVDHDKSCCPGKISCGNCIRGILCTSCNSKLEWMIRYSERAEKYVRGLIS